MKALGVVSLVMWMMVGCSNPAPIGGACEEAGKTEDICEDGGVCGKETNGELQCLKVCTQQSDCAANQECNGVEGSSLKGCRLKTK